MYGRYTHPARYMTCRVAKFNHRVRFVFVFWAEGFASNLQTMGNARLCSVCISRMWLHFGHLDLL